MITGNNHPSEMRHEMLRTSKLLDVVFLSWTLVWILFKTYCTLYKIAKLMFFESENFPWHVAGDRQDKARGPDHTRKSSLWGSCCFSSLILKAMRYFAPTGDFWWAALFFWGTDYCLPLQFWEALQWEGFQCHPGEEKAQPTCPPPSPSTLQFLFRFSLT